MTNQVTQRDQNEDLHMTALEAQEQLDRVTAGGRVPQDIAITALKEVEGLRYEYAAQVWRPLLGKWLFLGPSGLWESPRRAHWYMSPSTAKHMAMEEYPEKQVQIVARAYSQPVPVEENTNA